MAVCGIQKMLGFASLNPTYPTLQESLGPYTMESPACYTCRTTGLTCKNEDTEVNDVVRKSVNEFYATAAIHPQKELPYFILQE